MTLVVVGWVCARLLFELASRVGAARVWCGAPLRTDDTCGWEAGDGWARPLGLFGLGARIGGTWVVRCYAYVYIYIFIFFWFLRDFHFYYKAHSHTPVQAARTHAHTKKESRYTSHRAAQQQHELWRPWPLELARSSAYIYHYHTAQRLSSARTWQRAQRTRIRTRDKAADSMFD